jgi:plasmid stabilization system protein ParE
VTSYYWENLDGLHSATAFMTDQGDVAARDVAVRRGLTHLLVSGDKRKPAIFNYIKTGNPSAEDAEATLLARLFRSVGEAPSWFESDTELTEVGQRAYVFKGLSNAVPLDREVRVFHLKQDDSGR